MLIIVYVIYLILSLIKWVVWSIASYIQWEKELGLEPTDGWMLDRCREGKESGRVSWEHTMMWIYHMFSAEALFKGDASNLLVQSRSGLEADSSKVRAKQTKSKWPLLLRDSPYQTNALGQVTVTGSHRHQSGQIEVAEIRRIKQSAHFSCPTLWKEETGTSSSQYTLRI